MAVQPNTRPTNGQRALVQGQWLCPGCSEQHQPQQSCQQPTRSDGQASPRGCIVVARHLFFFNWGVLYLLPCFSLYFPYSLSHRPQTVGTHNCKIHKGENTLVRSKLWHLKPNVTGYVIHKVTINVITLNKCALKQLLQLL